MTIKEIEELTGLSHENIMFYEREGLISPNLQSDGCIDFSILDLKLLLKIKLLRQLNVSTDQILKLIDGTKSLHKVLSSKIDQSHSSHINLNLSDSQDQYLLIEDSRIEALNSLCESIMKEAYSFDRLDASKHLSVMEANINANSEIYFPIHKDVIPKVHNPWRRYFARMFDMSLYNLIWIAIMLFVFNFNFGHGVGPLILLSFLTFVTMILVEPIFLGLFGTTPGKALLGFSIRDNDGGKLPYAEGLRRSFWVGGDGMGFNIPIYTLVRLWKNYKLCSKEKELGWDFCAVIKLAKSKWYHYFNYIVASVLIIAIGISLPFIKLIPPNRSDLTISEFAQNYNYYSDTLRLGSEVYRLDDSAQWTRRYGSDDPLHPLNSVTPEFAFAIENDLIKGLTLSVEIKDRDKYIYSYNDQIILSALSFATTRKSIGLNRSLYNSLIAKLNQPSFNDFTFTELGITFSCAYEIIGYRDSHHLILLVDSDYDAERYFKMVFTIVIDN